MSSAGNEEIDQEASPWLDVNRERQAWRERAVRGVAWSLCVTAGFSSVWYAVVPNAAPQMLPVLATATVLTGGVALARRVPVALRASVLVMVLYLASASSVRLVGYAPNPFMGFGVAVVGATVFLGRRAGLLVVHLILLTIVLISLAHREGLIERVQGWQQHLDSTDGANIARVTVMFHLVSMTTVVGISYLLRQSEGLLFEKARMVQTLQVAQLERERATSDLELRQGAFQKGRELELLGRLAGSMAHDFNNALLVIWAALDEIALSPSAPTASALEAIRAAADQAAATTRQLRAFGPMAPRSPTRLALTPVMAKAKAMFGRVLPPNIELCADVATDALIVADEGEVLRVLMNLTLNARDAMRDGGRLTLRVRPLREEESASLCLHVACVAIQVEDTGTGMPDEVKERLFEPFFTTKLASGTGLGLASVRDIVEAQGGRVTVASELGKGTTISVFWPVAVKTLASERPPAVVVPTRPTVVLLVDDDALVRGALRRGLTRAGMTVLEAADGGAALVLARQGAAIDILCADCVMPGIPVRELIAAFRELHHAPVVVCSGYAPAETGLSPEAFSYFLPKPFTSEQLVATIRRVVEEPWGREGGEVPVTAPTGAQAGLPAT